MEEGTTVKSTGIRYGLNTSIFILVYTLAMQLIFNSPERAFGLTTHFLILLGTIYAHRFFKGRNEGLMTLGEGFSIGMLVTVIAGLVASLYFYVYVQFFNPMILKQILGQVVKSWEAQGFSEEQIAALRDIFARFMTPFMLTFMNYVAIVLVGTIVVAIASFINKRTEKPENEE